jgi:hypothetical protein
MKEDSACLSLPFRGTEGIKLIFSLHSTLRFAAPKNSGINGTEIHSTDRR